MTIERSHGKARPTLPRSSDLADAAPAPEVDRNRDERGRAVAGNTLGVNKGVRAALRKMIARETKDPLARAVADDAWKIFAANVAELPSSGSIVRGLLLRKARHEALSAFWEMQATAKGLATPEGIEAQEMAMKHGQRAERLAVTAIDVATKLKTETKTGDAAPSWFEKPDGAP